MKRMDWRQAAEVVGIAALVASLVFVGLQMKQAREIAMSENDMALLQSQVAIDNALNEHAGLWIKAQTSQPLDSTERFVFRNLVIMINDASFFDHLRAERLGQPEIEQAIVHGFAAFLFQYPAARREWLEREESLIRYRNVLAPNGSDFSSWKTSVTASLAVLDRASGVGRSTR